MLLRLGSVALLFLTSACQNAQVKVLIGETAVLAPGTRPIEDAVIVVAGSQIRSVGYRKDIPIPQDSERTGLSGKWVVPAPGGRIAPGEEATLLVLDRAPRDAAPAASADVSRRLVSGSWQ